MPDATPEPIRVWRVYTGDDAQTHVEALDVPLARGGAGAISQLFTGSGVIMRRTYADYDLDWHPAPRRQLVVTLTGRVEIEVSDGA